jgi:peptidoglycan/LPS O-acetylase OafA/YrhL
MTARRYDLDWLRVFTIGGVFLFHSTCFYAVNNFYFANTTTNVVFLVLSTFFLLWIMPVLFVISGMVTLYLLKSSKPGDVIKQRFFRLIVPFVFGVLAILPFLVYLKEKTLGIFSGSFTDFYLYQYYHGVYGIGGNFPIFGLHLWYLLYLFAFSIVAIIIARLFWTHEAKRRMERSLHFLERPGAIFLLSIPIVLTSYISYLEPEVIGRTNNGGWGIVPYVIFFFYGMLFAFDPRFDTILQRHWKVAAVTSGIFIILYGWTIGTSLNNTLNPWVMCVIIGMAAFSIIVLLFGLFHSIVHHGSEPLKRMNEAVLPFYIIHFPVLVFVAYFVTSLHLNIFFMYLLISALSLLIILALCALVSRVPLLRWLFGMKRKKEKEV